MKQLLSSLALFCLLAASPGYAQGPGPGGGAGPGPVPNQWVQNGPTLSYSQGGLALPATVAGGGKGVGTINVQALYLNGVPFASIATATLPLQVTGSNIALNYSSNFILSGSNLELSTINSNTGSFGGSTAIPNFTVDGKGRISAAGTSVVIAPAGTLTGTTLNATVITSSLTSVGTITGGTWSSAITGATINNSVIGATTQAAGSFTTVNASTSLVSQGHVYAQSTNAVAESASSPLVLNATTGALTCPTCATTGGGGAISATAPIDFTSNVISLNNNGVTYAKFQQVAAVSLVGNPTGSLANAQGITLGATLAFSGTALQTAAMSGDLTTPANSFVTTLATVNSNVGAFGSSTAIPTITANGKGLITAITTNAVIAPAGTLTGTVLASNVVTSSLTSVGTLTGGATGAGFTIALTTSTVTGTLPCANHPALTGNVTTSAGSCTTTIAANAVTRGMLAQGSGLSVIGVTGSATANVADIVGVANQALRVNGAGTALAFGAIDLSQAAATTGVIQAASYPATTGDVTSVAGALATTISNNAVTNAKAAQMATNTVKGNLTSGTANATDMAMPSCSTAQSALIWTTNTGFGCNVFGSLALLSTVNNGNWSGTALAIGNGGTSQTTAPNARAASGLNIFGLISVGDANATVATTDRGIGLTTTLTAVRTLTLPAASAVNKGEPITIADIAGAINGANTITVARAGSDTINGLSSVSMTTAYQVSAFYSDGVSKWTYLTAGSGGGGGSGTVTQINTGTGLAGGPITATGTVSLAPITADNLLMNSTGSAAAPIPTAVGNCTGAAKGLTYDTSTHTFGCTTNTVGTVTSVGFTGGLISVATATTTPAFTVAGTSGGVPYFSSSSTWASSAALAANAIVIGGGAGTAPATITTAAGIVTWIGTPSSANLAAAITDETGSGSLVFGTSPSLTTPNLGTPSAVTLTNATGCPIASCISGLGTGVATAAAVNGGSAGALSTLFAKGQKALATGAISSTACATDTVTVTSLATTDIINVTFSADPTATTGYAPVVTGGLAVYWWPTSGQINIKVCNPTTSSITPGAVTLNYSVLR